jgi:hypothetical protein
MIRELKVREGYDYRNDPEKAKYGQGAPHLEFIVKNEDGAVVFMIHTGWYLNMQAVDPSAAQISFHKPITDPHVDFDTIHEECEYIGEACCGHSRYSGNDYLLKMLKEQGSDAVFEELEKIHKEEL